MCVCVSCCCCLCVSDVVAKDDEDAEDELLSVLRFFRFLSIVLVSASFFTKLPVSIASVDDDEHYHYHRFSSQLIQTIHGSWVYICVWVFIPFNLLDGNCSYSAEYLKLYCCWNNFKYFVQSKWWISPWLSCIRHREIKWIRISDEPEYLSELFSSSFYSYKVDDCF